MNKQRKVVITTTYNEMGIIIDTKAEEVAQPNLQPTCNQLAKDICVPCKDTISRQEAIEALDAIESEVADGEGFRYAKWREYFENLPSAQPEPPMQIGWICPVCGRGLSPLTSVCPCNNGKGWEITC